MCFLTFFYKNYDQRAFTVSESYIRIFLPEKRKKNNISHMVGSSDLFLLPVNPF